MQRRKALTKPVQTYFEMVGTPRPLVSYGLSGKTIN